MMPLKNYSNKAKQAVFFAKRFAKLLLKEDKHQALSTLEMITKLEAVKQQLLSLKDAL